MAARVYLGLGGNLGDRAGYLGEALRQIGQFTELRRVSPIYETDPWGPVEQGPFLNLAAEVETDLAPLDLLAALQGVERDLGRERRVRWGPRTMDIDILLYDGLVWDKPELTLPHPRMAERAFVLVPLADLAPGLVPPGWRLTIAETLERVGRSGVRDGSLQQPDLLSSDQSRQPRTGGV